MSPLRLGAVKYINSLPFFAPFQLEKLQMSAKLIFDVPSSLNQSLLKNRLDLSFVSSIFHLVQKQEFPRISDHCIAADNEVGSVNLYTKVPISELNDQVIALTEESKTSIALLKVLCYHFWKVEPYFEPLLSVETATEYPAFLLIGDAAFQSKEIPGYTTIDLANAWKKATGLPFTFAVLIGRNEVFQKRPQELAKISDELDQALEWSNQNKELLYSLALERTQLPEKAIDEYYSFLQFKMTDEHKKSLDLFESLYRALPELQVTQ